MTIITPEALEGLAGDEISHGGAVPVGIIRQSNKTTDHEIREASSFKSTGFQARS